ncbi:hypothetical protein ES703_29050 [subsurface metagenome]
MVNIIEDIFNHAVDKSDVGSRAYRAIDISFSGGPGESGVNADKFGPFLFSFSDVAKCGRVILGGVRADGKYGISICDVIPVVGHGPAAECFRQTGDSGGMSYTGVMFKIHQTEGPG